MIAPLFLPDYYNNKRLYSQYRAGIFFGTHALVFVLIAERRGGWTLEACEEFKLEDGSSKTELQRRIALLKTVATRIPKHAVVHVAIPAEQTLSKELTLPFFVEEKIRKVLDYEVESLIPFSLDEAIIDFTPLAYSEVKERATLLVTATRKEVVEKHLQMYEKSGINPTVITTDILAICGLYAALPTFISERTATLIALLTPGMIKCALMVGSKAVFIRTITVPADNALLKEHLTTQIGITIASFERTQQHPPVLEKIVMVAQEEVSIAGTISSLLGEICEVPVVALEPKELIASLPLKNKTKNEAFVTAPLALSACALVIQGTDYRSFNLRRKELAIPLVGPIAHYLTIATLLFTLFIGGIGAYGYYTITTLREEGLKIERLETAKLKKILPLAQRKASKNVKSLVATVKTYLHDQAKLWAPFSQQRLRPLLVLQELSLLMNKKRFPITTTRLSIGKELAEDTDQETTMRSIEVEGVLKSQTGTDHFKHFGQFEEVVKNSRVLALTRESDPSPTEKNDGVQFTLQLKLRNVQQYEGSLKNEQKEEGASK